jgi:molybdopterin-synthase adenylyltransferase
MNKTRYSRQSFLGIDSDDKIKAATIGIVGLGGGGSHIAQQLAHLGFCRIFLFDGDTIEDSNLNRTVGSTEADILLKNKKVRIAERMIRGVQGNAFIKVIDGKWQHHALTLRECDIIIGCVDSFAERRELEISARRYLIPYIDIGMTVKHVKPDPPRMTGQVFLSMPGELCMSCVGILSDSNLRREAENYGAAGDRPQVVWANGVLASTAIGIVVDLVTGWTQRVEKLIYFVYDGNLSTVQPFPYKEYLPDKCIHYDDHQVGDPIFKKF